MLVISGLTVSYNGLPVLNDINLTLKKGESLSIIGESGAGKTTLGLSIMGLVEGSCSGEILFNGINIPGLQEEELRRLRGREMAMVFQNMGDALHPLYTVLDQVVEAISVHSRADGASLYKKALDLLISTGLDEKTANSYPHQISGGQKQRAMIAMAMANNPGVLILDEPTASLDAGTKAEIIAMLKNMAGDRITLMITHDISSAAIFSEKVAVLYGGRLVESGRTEEVFSNPRHPYTRGLIRSYPDLSTTKDLQGIPGRMNHGVTGCPFHPRCTQRIEICCRETPKPENVNGRVIACHRGGIVPVLEIRNLSKSFNTVKAVQNLDLTLYEGETLSLVGESGSGKTTLARTVMGLLNQDKGEIFLEGERVSGKTAKFYQRVQMVFQNPMESISHRMNVLQAVREPLDVNRNEGQDARKELVRRVLDEVELPGDDTFLNKYPHHLSGGEAQRVAIARALVLDPKIIIADEATSALDASVQAKILRLLMSIQEKRGLAIILITHDIALARKVSDRMAVMINGVIIEEGPSARVINNPEHDYTRNLIGYTRNGKI
ncbi:MAG: ABC transporter ATP-binding protein [Actinobacteria bacterium]|nr:ABC transporter ATP-binding protein [Actinomycetota bacterium]